MSFFSSLFAYNRRQQRGILFLLFLLLVLYAAYWLLSRRPSAPIEVIDTSAYQKHIDSLKQLQARKKDTIYPFNPNYITDYKGYKLGLATDEIDRLHRFRESGKWINSAQQFKAVTEVDQKWLDSISPYFKFPDWVNNPRPARKNYQRAKGPAKRSNINSASAEQLKQVYGIGPAYAKRILKERERLGGFIDFRQVRGVYGITDSTLIKIEERFYITPPQGFEVIALNSATREQLLAIPYFNDYLVDELIKERTLREGFSSWDEVLLTSRFPEEKLPLIQLYLALD